MLVCCISGFAGWQVVLARTLGGDGCLVMFLAGKFV